MQRIALKLGRFYRSIPRSVNTSVNNYNKSVPYLQYSTSSLTGAKTLSNGFEDKLNETSVLKRNVMHSTETKNWHQIESIKFFAEEHVLQIQFSDGQALNFNTFWLRDSCRCPQCVHPVTKIKLTDTADISEDLFVERIEWFEDTIEVQWRTGLTEDHISQYSVEWLKKFEDVFEANPMKAVDKSLISKAQKPNDGFYESIVPKPEVFLWNSNQINKQNLTTNYEDFMGSAEALRSHLKTFCQFGVAFIEGVPILENAILEVARRMAYEKTTSYGPSFEVSAASQETGAILESHTDLPYRERSPGVRLLHCLRQASAGGGSTLVDGLNCAETFRKTNPQLFDVLTKNLVLFSFCDKENDLWFREKWPIIALNSDQSIKEIHYSKISMRPPLLPLKILDQFYTAYRSVSLDLSSCPFINSIFLQQIFRIN